jgi:hypothetical protein
MVDTRPVPDPEPPTIAESRDEATTDSGDQSQLFEGDIGTDPVWDLDMEEDLVD